MLKKKLSALPFARPLALMALQATSFDTTIKNPWTGDRLRLNTYTHKTYWFYRKNRERSSMEQFQSLVNPGDTVVEVGGHIGFIAQFLASLAGPNGEVVVFEPGINNLGYTRANLAVLSNAKLEEIAVSDHDGTATFYEDTITGQNNSLLPNYRNVADVAETHGVDPQRVEHSVRTCTLDSYCDQHQMVVDFMKIDVEGHELAVLKGATKTMKGMRALMVEVSEDYHEVSTLLRDNEFDIFDEAGQAIDSAERFGNYFAINRRLA